MATIIKSSTFDLWLSNLRDRAGAARVLVRIGRLTEGNPGDNKGVGDGVMELRLAFGPGYRVYYFLEREAVIVLLAGGDKSTQEADIARAKQIAREWSVASG